MYVWGGDISVMLAERKRELYKLICLLQYNIQAPVSTHFTFPPQIFMFDFVSDHLLKLATRAQLKLANSHAPITPETYYAAFYNEVKRDRIAPVVAFVNSHQVSTFFFN